MRTTRRRVAVLAVVLSTVAACGTEQEPEAVSSAEQGLHKLSGAPKAPCNRTDAPCVDLYVGAHPDDDLLFMNPDIINSIRSGNRVIVIVKNGGYHHYDDPERIEEARYWLNRERGILNAYAYMARGDSATISNDETISQNGRMIPSGFTRVVSPGESDAYVVTLDPPPPNPLDPPPGYMPPIKLPRFDIVATGGNLVTVMFLRVQDAASASLWLENTATRPIRECPAVEGTGQDLCAGGEGLGAQNITRASLIKFYKTVMQGFGVTSVSILDATDINIDSYGDPGQYDGYSDNWEHTFTAKFALAAAAEVQAVTEQPISIRSSRGYTLELEEANLATGESEQVEKQRAFLYYAMFDQAALWPSVGGAPSEYCGSTCVAPDPNMPNTQPSGATTTNRMTGIIPFNLASTYFSSPDTHVPRALYGAQNWQSKKYTTRTLVGTEPLTGRIRNGNGSCLAVSATYPYFSYFTSCSEAPAWTVTRANRISIQISGVEYCLSVDLVANPPATAPESVTMQPCGASNGSQTMFMFGNGQIRTPQARCLAQSGSTVRSEDCRPIFDIPKTGTVLSASTTEPGYPPEYASDGNLSTRWSSQSLDDQYIIFDLGVPMPISVVRLHWETAYGRDYEIQLSNNGFTYTTCGGCLVTNGDGGIDDVVLTTPATARFVRMHGITRGTQWGFSLWEISVLRPIGRPTPAQDWTLLFDPIQLSSSYWSNSTIYDNYDYYYRTFSIVNRNVCMRQANGVYCMPSTGGLSLGPPAQNTSDFANAAGWGTSPTGSTVRGVWSGPDPGGGTVACGRGYYGVSCTNGLFSSDYSTGNGWSYPQYYETIRYPDLFQDGQLHVCGRGYWGISCALNQGGWLASSLLLTSQFSTGMGWDHPSNASTIQFGDINGDGRLDVCGRSDAGIRCAIMAPDSAYYTNGRDWSFDTDRTAAVRRDFGNYDPVVNWASNRSYYGSIRLVDINRDGLADVCGRGPSGLYCAFSSGTHFEAKRFVLWDISDASGWGYDSTGGTLSFGDVNGNMRMDLCVRGIYGVSCSEGY